MTIPYSDTFFRLLFRWKASLWKSVLPSLALYLALYYVLFLPLLFCLNEEQKVSFSHIRESCDRYLNYMPITFILGFYVTHVANRWWEQFLLISRPDRFMLILIGYVSDEKEEVTTIQRNIGRWLNLMSALYYQVEVGLMTPREMEMYEAITAPFGKSFAETVYRFTLVYVPYYIVSVVYIWIQKALTDLRNKGYLTDLERTKLYEELSNYRSGVTTLMMYSWTPIPLAYTQVVTLATWGYFLISMIANMDMHSNAVGVRQPQHDMYFPPFLVLQFIFYLGWLKVAQQMLDPFGEEDDDFEMNFLIDRNASVTELLATSLASSWPGYSNDSFVDTSRAVPLRYTKEAANNPGHYPDGNLNHLIVKQENQVTLDLEETEMRLLQSYKRDKNSIKKVFKKLKNRNHGSDESVL